MGERIAKEVTRGKRRGCWSIATWIDHEIEVRKRKRKCKTDLPTKQTKQ